jgi:MFS family permease
MPAGPGAAASASRRPGTFAALRHRNFRLFFGGQCISLIGTWMQRIAQAWLVLQITNSPFLLGVVGALQWAPVLLFALPAGVIADRVNKRNLIVATQTVQMLQALALGLLILAHAVRFWHVAVLAIALGTAQAFDMPARQAFIFEMVEGADMMNAVALNSTIVNVARLLGPAIAGIAIGWVGMAWAFLGNGLSFVPVIGALALMQVRPVQIVQTEAGLLEHLREGMVYLLGAPVSLQAIIVLAAESIFAMNFTLLTSVYAKDVLHMQATGFGLLMSAQGAGALAGAIAVASLAYLGPHPAFLYGGAICLALANIALAAVRHFVPAAVMLGIGGASLVTFTATVNTTLQIHAPDRLRGRVMSVYSLVLGGLTPVGALVSGGLAEVWGAGGAFGVGGTVALACTLGVLRWRPTAGPAPARASPTGGSIGSAAQGRKHAPPGAR